MGLKSAERTKSKPKIIRNKKKKNLRKLSDFCFGSFKWIFIDLRWSIILGKLEKHYVVLSYVCSFVTLWGSFGYDLFWSQWNNSGLKAMSLSSITNGSSRQRNNILPSESVSLYSFPENDRFHSRMTSSHKQAFDGEPAAWLIINCWVFRLISYHSHHFYWQQTVAKDAV